MASGVTTLIYKPRGEKVLVLARRYFPSSPDADAARAEQQPGFTKHTSSKVCSTKIRLRRFRATSLD